jgi:antitoxin component YwqK of YwqJK toxin-antitoxin module
MEMVSLARLAPGLNRCFCIIAFVGLFACQTDSKRKANYYDADKVKIQTSGGITYVNTTPLSGVVFSLNQKRDTVFVMPYLNGKEHGLAKHFHDNGQVKSLRYNKNGWKEGEHIGWFESGRKQFEYHFKNDMFEGNQKEWLADGMLYSDLNYEKGMESGSQRVWYRNGKIKTNYIIKNNRRYGLLGTKNCVNASDSIFSMP